MLHRRRFYRYYGNSGKWTIFNVALHTTDLYIRALKQLNSEALEHLTEARKAIEKHIDIRTEFLTSLDPLTWTGEIHPLLAEMYKAGETAGTGPMAAVAGAIAEYTGKKLSLLSEEVIVENGGDIWLNLQKPVTIGLYMDNIYFRDRLALKINGEKTPCSVCTSSSKTGHSISFGKADSVTVIAGNGAIADAAATAACNMVHTEDDIKKGIDFAMSLPTVSGCLIVIRDRFAASGEIELAPPIQ